MLLGDQPRCFLSLGLCVFSKISLLQGVTLKLSGKYPDETRSKTLAASLLGHSPETQWQVPQQGVEEEVRDIV